MYDELRIRQYLQSHLRPKGRYVLESDDPSELRKLKEAEIGKLPPIYVREAGELDSGALPEAKLFSAFRSNWNGESVYFFGPVGCGKSVVMTWLALRMIDMGGKVLYFSVYEAKKYLLGTEQQRSECSQVPMLIIDSIQWLCDYSEDERIEIMSIIRDRLEKRQLTLVAVSTGNGIPEFPFKIYHRFPCHIQSDEPSLRRIQRIDIGS